MACRPCFFACVMTSRSTSVSSSAGAFDSVFFSVLPAAGAAACGSPPLMAASLFTSSETSISPSEPPSATLSIICPSVSQHLKRVSMISSFSFSWFLRIRSKTSSISCVSFAILLKPIVADIPFSVWAFRKISFTTERSSILSSRLKSPSLRDCRCSCDSSRNISMY